MKQSDFPFSWQFPSRIFWQYPVLLPVCMREKSLRREGEIPPSEKNIKAKDLTVAVKQTSFLIFFYIQREEFFYLFGLLTPCKNHVVLRPKVTFWGIKTFSPINLNIIWNYEPNHRRPVFGFKCSFKTILCYFLTLSFMTELIATDFSYVALAMSNFVVFKVFVVLIRFLQWWVNLDFLAFLRK